MMPVTSVPWAVQGLGNGQGNGAAYAAADHADIFEAFNFSCSAQRADKVMDTRPL